MRIDSGAIETGNNYGGALYRSRATGRLYFITTSKTGIVEQYELSDNGTGIVTGAKVRELIIGGPCEGIVADDERGRLYIAEETRGVWEFGAEPVGPARGKLIAAVGDSGLADDVEGLALYAMNSGDGYLIVSSQGDSTFKVYQRSGAHRFIGAFAVEGVSGTDGIAVTGAPLSGPFAQGLFACHNGRNEKKCPIALVPWEDIARAWA